MITCVAIGVSAGGMTALSLLLPALPAGLKPVVVVVQHLHREQNGFMLQYYDERCALCVREAEDKQPVEPGAIYFAPPDYHLLIEENLTFVLSSDEKVRHSRPSIDVLFESAAEVYGQELAGVILTGANDDGARGIRSIKSNGGITVAQDPVTAEFPEMPRAAVETGVVDQVLPLEQIGHFISHLSK